MTEQQARDLAAQIFEIGTDQKLNVMTVKTYLDHWLTAKTATVSESSMREYKDRLPQLDFLYRRKG